MARRATPGKTKGKSARATVPRPRPGSSRRELERRLAEAIEQQAATATRSVVRAATWSR